MRDPHAEYTTRLAARRETVARLVRREELISRLRLGCVIAAGVLGWLAFRHGVPSPAWVLAPLAGFAVLVARHWDATAARQRAERAVVFYRRGLDRLEGTWAGGGETGERFRRPGHPYADDLDLFGHGSLFELLCTARTRAGEDTLASRCELGKRSRASAPDRRAVRVPQTRRGGPGVVPGPPRRSVRPTQVRVGSRVPVCRPADPSRSRRGRPHRRRSGRSGPGRLRGRVACCHRWCGGTRSRR